MPQLRKVSPGQPLRIPASTYNAFIDAATDFQESKMDGGAASIRSTRVNPSVILIKNELAGHLNMGDPVLVGASLNTTPGTNTAAWYDKIIMGCDHDLGLNSGAIAIMLQWTPVGQLGRAAVAGSCISKVIMEDEAHQYAALFYGPSVSAPYLKSAASGPVTILWKEAPEQREDWQPGCDLTRLRARAVVLLGATSGSGAVETCWARVVGYTPYALDTTPVTIQPNRWSYRCVEQQMTEEGWMVKTDGRIFTECLNGCEDWNGPTGVQGNGVNVDTLPTGFQLVPIRGGPVVQMSPGEDADVLWGWRFSCPNAVDGVCEDVTGAPPQAVAYTDRSYMMAMVTREPTLGVT